MHSKSLDMQMRGNVSVGIEKILPGGRESGMTKRLKIKGKSKSARGRWVRRESVPDSGPSAREQERKWRKQAQTVGREKKEVVEGTSQRNERNSFKKGPLGTVVLWERWAGKWARNLV